MDKISQRCYFAWESLQWGFCDVSCSCSFIFVLHFVVVLHLLLFFIFVAVLHSLLFNVIPHPSVDYRRVFTSILCIQPRPSQSDLWHFHFSLSEIFFHSFTASATVVGIFYPRAFFTLPSFTAILPVFIKASLGAGSSSLTFTRLHTDTQNTDLLHLFVWFTVIPNLHNQRNSFLNSTKYDDELLVVKV